MKLEIEKLNAPITIPEIDRFNNSSGYKLPEEYKEFLLNHNGGSCKNNLYKLKENFSSKGFTLFSVDEFFRLKVDSPLWIKSRANELGDGLLCIALCSGEHIILLSLREKDYGKIYFFDEDFTYEEAELTLLADNFEEFLNKAQESK